MIRIATGAALCAALFFAPPIVAEDHSIRSAVAGGDAGINLRYRYEFVDQDTFDEDANASTLRLRLNYQTDTWDNWSAFAEFDYVAEVLLDDFNSGGGTSGPDRDQYPVVADPDGADLNQLFLQWKSSDDTRVRVGRQRILLDNQRFVGGVGWRQNEQTYDALSVLHTGWERTTFFYSYVANVNRIFGAEVGAGDHEQSTHLLNVKVGLNDMMSVTGYAYLIDNDDMTSFSTNTFGLRATGTVDLGEGKLAWLAEFASQNDAADSTLDYDTSYLRLDANWKRDNFSVGAGFESLGSDNGQGFRTPLATLHAFNGWADQFLGTPPAGLDDFFVQASYSTSGWGLKAIFHDYSAESGGEDFGTEIDLSGSRKLGDHVTLLLKLALFNADSASYTDTTKAWVMFTTSF